MSEPGFRNNSEARSDSKAAPPTGGLADGYAGRVKGVNKSASSLRDRARMRMKSLPPIAGLASRGVLDGPPAFAYRSVAWRYWGLALAAGLLGWLAVLAIV